jgi:aarF domain-containing kinase
MLLERTWRAGLSSSTLGTRPISKPPVFKTLRNLSRSSPINGNTPRWQRYLRRTGYLGLGVGVVYGFDRYFNASAIGRNLRTLWAVCVPATSLLHVFDLVPKCALITADYKMNFTPAKSDQVKIRDIRTESSLIEFLDSRAA